MAKGMAVLNRSDLVSMFQVGRAFACPAFLPAFHPWCADARSYAPRHTLGTFSFFWIMEPPSPLSDVGVVLCARQDELAHTLIDLVVPTVEQVTT